MVVVCRLVSRSVIRELERLAWLSVSVVSSFINDSLLTASDSDSNFLGYSNSTTPSQHRILPKELTTTKDDTNDHTL